ncbi:PREDICTED: sperm protamine P1-type-like [Rhagoletis zephyria]|uniref:sperm protamine P1-type-like n=1 Tax=Rhagoletis zephyria TaxID=28612 RepID=UPI00081148CC|nr:PREDICTED: sperm protamine P1-type-like [Rhagoletis zephyria]
MSKTTKSTHNQSNQNNDDKEAGQYDEMSDELTVSSSDTDVVQTRKSRKLQPTDAADHGEGGMYDRGGRRRRRSGRRSGSRRRRSRSRSRRRRRR